MQQLCHVEGISNLYRACISTVIFIVSLAGQGLPVSVPVAAPVRPSAMKTAGETIVVSFVVQVHALQL